MICYISLTDSMVGLDITYPFRMLALLLLAFCLPPAAIAGVGSGCDDCCLHIALKTNLLHDAVITPDLGVEIALPKKFSVGVEGVYAWWSNDKAHRYWRIRGGWLDVNYWFGKGSDRRSLSGHHVGIYGSCHDFDFEFGHRGWQSPRPSFGVGVTYGYSLRLNNRLNLHFGLRAGYWGGHITRYIPQCGKYLCEGRYFKRYVGLTGVGVTLVWFPGRGKINNPTLWE